jgi:replication fork protection complex subunit Csm3/Swi3
MAQVSSRQSDAAAVPADDLDDLFDYDVNRDDVLRDVDPNMDAPIVPKLSGGKENALGLGIDEEIKIIKQRKPVPKLDEPRCVCHNGTTDYS